MKKEDTVRVKELDSIREVSWNKQIKINMQKYMPCKKNMRLLFISSQMSIF